MKEQTEVVRDAMQARDDIQLGLVASRTCQRHDGTTVRGTKLRCNPSVRPSITPWFHAPVCCRAIAGL